MPAGTVLDTADVSEGGFVDDPHPTYARLRAAGSLVRDEASGLLLVPRHRDVDALLRDRRFGRVFTPRQPEERFGPWNLVNSHAMLELEPPEHTRLRRLVASEFTPRRVAALRPRITELVDDLLDDLLEPLTAGGDVDLVAAVAEPLPVAVIAELLGIPAGDRGLLRPWSNAIVGLYELSADRATEEAAIAAARDFAAYLRALVAERRRRPAGDLLSALAVQSVEGERLSEDELVATAVLLLNAGHEASVNVLGNGVVALLRQPRQWARLVRAPELAASAVEEVIRYDTPLSLFQRTAFEEVPVGDDVVRPGQRVGLLLASANRDPEAFPDADVLDIGRSPNPHVGFGAGIHFCLGAPLARVELEVALRRLVARVPHLRLAAEPVRRPSFQFRGFRAVMVTAS